jgi:hypothetical protein
MASAQRRAEATLLDFAYGPKPAGEFTDWEMLVDGHGFRVAAWSHQLERDLPTVAEGYEGLPTPTAVGFAKALVGRWFDDCIGTSLRMEDDDSAPVVNDDGRNEWWWPILATEFDALPVESKRRLQQADDLVGRWIVGELPVETIIEEVHTIAEAVLRSATGLGRGSNWPSLVKEALAQRMITADDGRIFLRFSTVYRNRLKHEAGMLGIESDPEALVSDVVLVLDHIERFAKAPLSDAAASELDALRDKAEELMAKAYTEAGLPPPKGY